MGTTVSILPPDRARTGFAWMLGLLLLVPITKAVLADSIDPDFFWHVRVADQLLTRGIGPIPDPFSFMSNGGTWTPFSWLGELLMKWTYDRLGLRGVVGVHALCSTLFFAFIALSCVESTRQIASEPRRAATLISVAFSMAMSLAFLSFRPVTVALALMSGMTWLLWRDRRTIDRAVWLLVPATVVLTNLHLYVILFVVGLWARTVGAAIDAWVEKRPLPVRSIALAASCSLGALCTPLLPGCIRNALWFNGQDPMVLHKLVAEITPFYDGGFGKILLAGVVAISAFSMRAALLSRRESIAASVPPSLAPAGVPTSEQRLGFENLLWLLAATFFLFQMGRFSTVYCLVAAPIAAATLPRVPSALLARRSIQFATASVALLLVGRVVLAFPRGGTTMDAWLTRTGDDDGLKYPTAAASYVEANVPRRTGHLVNELTWGGYLIWRLGDHYQVFMDGRTLIYPASFWESLYLRGETAKHDLIASQSADAAILPASKSLLRSTLVGLGWHEVYADSRAIVMVPPLVTPADATATTNTP